MHRSLADKFIAWLRHHQMSTPELTDAMYKSGAIPDIYPLCRNQYAVGKVFPAYCRDESNWDLHKRINAVRPGDIVLIETDQVNNRAVLGELVCQFLFVSRQAGAVVINGSIRDVSEIRRNNRPVWCKGISPLGCFNTPVAYPSSPPIYRAWDAIYHGAIAVCDDNGVAIIRADQITEELYRRVAFIRLQEKIWRYCIEVKGWSTYETICLKRYLEPGQLPNELQALLTDLHPEYATAEQGQDTHQTNVIALSAQKKQ